MTRITRILLGLTGGFCATGPMTATMLALHRWLPGDKQYPLPPREIATLALNPPDEETAALATLGAHFAFGSAMGAAYAAAVPSLSKRWGWKGCIAGIAVWALNYCLVLPLLNILRPAHKSPPERNWLMVIAHLVWGLAIAGFLASTTQDTKSRALFEASPRRHRDQA